MTPHEDDLLRALSRLPARDVDPWRAERTRSRALAALRRERELAQRPWLRRVRVAYRRAIEPALVFGVSTTYLAWAVNTVLGLYR